VVATGAYAKEGHGSAPQWLGGVTGSSDGAARGRLAAAERAAATPILTDALHEGDLSPAQLSLVTKTAAEVKEAPASLLALAQEGASHQQMSDAADRLRAAARR